MAPVTTYIALARKWAKGWELHVPDVGVTQARTLDSAQKQVRDYIASMTDIDPATIDVELKVELDGVQAQIEALHRLQADRTRAATQLRQIVSQLRGMHVSVSDIAKMLGVSRGRVTQLR
jgi:DNA-directed RNA polymerase specialized sigma subunit